MWFGFYSNLKIRLYDEISSAVYFVGNQNSERGFSLELQKNFIRKKPKSSKRYRQRKPFFQGRTSNQKTISNLTWRAWFHSFWAMAIFICSNVGWFFWTTLAASLSAARSRSSAAWCALLVTDFIRSICSSLSTWPRAPKHSCIISNSPVSRQYPPSTAQRYDSRGANRQIATASFKCFDWIRSRSS